MDFTHGIVYTPQNIKPQKWSVEDIRDRYPVMSWVRIYWVDMVNIRRCRIVPVEYFLKMLEANRPGVNIAKVALGLVYLNVAEGFSGVGEYLYAIDTATLRPCPFAPGHWAVLGNFEEKAAISGPDGTPTVKVDLCPRTVLRRITDQIKEDHNTEFLLGFETEFILLKSTDPAEPVNIHDWSASVGLLAGTDEAQALEEIGNALRSAGFGLEMLHAEAAPGQYEVVLGPLSPMDAADALIFTREIIVQVAAKHKLHATFAPRPFMNSAGSSAHAHISVHSPDSQKTADGLSPQESAFLAGLLAHLPGITALTLPTPASYRRVADGVWSGGTYVCYGTENREAPVRLTNAASPASRNFELRFIDGTANPHLAIAGVLAGGLIGLRSKMPLEMKDCEGPMSAAQMTEAERKALGITKRMPLNIHDARSNLEKDPALGEVFGRHLIEKYLAVNKTLETSLALPNETEVQQLTRLVKFY